MEHADKALPEVFITVFGERHRLIASFGTFARYEKATGKNALDGLNWTSPSATDLVTLIWAALGGERFGRTTDEVADELNMTHLEDVKRLIQTMFRQSELPAGQKKADAA
jgi:hypothetical protein